MLMRRSPQVSVFCALEELFYTEIDIFPPPLYFACPHFGLPLLGAVEDVKANNRSALPVYIDGHGRTGFGQKPPL